MIQWQYDHHVRAWEGVAFVRRDGEMQRRQAKRDNYRVALASERRHFDGATEAYEKSSPRDPRKPMDRACAPVARRLRKKPNRRERIARRLARASVEG